ncbi:MAG TPA: thioredoxin domain-containing protein [Candidatus Krumholzibacteria bacterium]
MSGSANRLSREKSPYLLQHAHNPVDWFPWGDEAFAAARERDCPVFLSIGYSTCHWCHVMERESFEDGDVAALMNRAFVCVKVDREERPDVDHVYMMACQMMTGSGGWPLSLLLTPDRRPFFAATYIPPDAMRSFIPRVEAAWRDQRDDVLANAGQMADALSRAMDTARSELPFDDVLRRAYHELAARYDASYGGFGARPKFPSPHTFLLLLRHWKRTGDAQALEMVEKSLERMRRGGIFDQVGYGFHRYSTDAMWLVPHFEKMLYDQALLLLAYTEAYQATKREDFKQTAIEIAEYVMRDLSAPEGGFFCAEDADSEGVEGKFYVWTRDELATALGDDAALAIACFGVEDDGNFIEEATGHRTGANILHLPRPDDEAARALGIDVGTLHARLALVRSRLLAIRSRRARPHLDDKVLTDWNGFMIGALARSGRVCGQPDHVARAVRAAEFIAGRMAGDDGSLRHRFRDGEAAIDGMLDDYAFLSWGLLELYESTFDEDYLRRAIAHTRYLIDHFHDDGAGGFFMTPRGGEALVARPREVYDGATPSGNSVAALNLARLSRFTGEMDYDRRARDVIAAFGAQVSRAPMAHCGLLLAVDFLLGPSAEVVLSGTRGAPDVAALSSALETVYVPARVVLFRPADAPDAIGEIAPYTRAQAPAEDGHATAYVCRQFACDLPTTDPAKMLALLAAPRE